MGRECVGYANSIEKIYFLRRVFLWN